MELPGATLLYTVAALAMTFIGFSAIVMILRQTLGHKLSRFDALLAHVYMEFGLMITAAALLPPILAYWGLPHIAVWQISSGIAAIPPFLFAVTYPTRRRSASGQSTPFYVWVNVSTVLLVSLALAVSATGILNERSMALYLTAISVFLIFAVATFLQALNIILRTKPRFR